MAEGIDGIVASEIQRRSPWLKDCVRCGAPVQKRTRMARQFCSDDCAKKHKAHIRKTKPTPVCGVCGNDFIKKSARQKFCEACRPQARRSYTRAYNSENVNIVLKSRRDYMNAKRLANPEETREKHRLHRLKHKDRINAQRRCSEHREKVRPQARARYKLPRNRVHSRVSRLIHQALREKKAGRKWESLVGYTVAQLCAHLEKQFTKGMSWKNIGQWHIDHILPRKLFNFESAEDADFKACWALTNLQPLWEIDNKTKSAKRLHLL